MKNIILIAAVMMFGTVGFGQLKVVGPSGNVKVGETAVAPASKLHVQNAGYCGLFVESTNAAAQVRLRSSSAAFVFDDITGTQQGAIQFNIPTQQFIFNNNLGGRIFFTTGNGNNMSWDNGRLGLGTGAPSQALHVVGSAFKNDGSTTWLTTSDKRLKKNIKNYTDGLEEVLKINPVWFTYNGKGGSIEGNEVVGILAQEMQKIAPYMIGEIELADVVETNIDKDGVPIEKRSGIETYLTYDANALPYMLVNAIQEQHEVITESEEIIASLEERISKLESLILSGAQTNPNNQTQNIQETFVFQNTPNPTSNITKIEYSLDNSEKVNEIIITDLNGKMIKKYTLQSQTGSVDFDASNVISGTYIYSLYSNNKLVKSNKMLIIK